LRIYFHMNEWGLLSNSRMDGILEELNECHIEL
jgi:hypothetical protein